MSSKFSSITSYDIVVVKQTTVNSPHPSRYAFNFPSLPTQPGSVVPITDLSAFPYHTRTCSACHGCLCFWFRKWECILQLQLDPGFSLYGAKYWLTEWRSNDSTCWVLWQQGAVVIHVRYCIVRSRQLMPPDALQPKAYCTNPGL